MVGALPELVLSEPPYLLAALRCHQRCQRAVRAEELRVSAEQLERHAIDSRRETEARPVQRSAEHGVAHAFMNAARENLSRVLVTQQETPST